MGEDFPNFQEKKGSFRISISLEGKVLENKQKKKTGMVKRKNKVAFCFRFERRERRIMPKEEKKKTGMKWEEKREEENNNYKN